jgi:hypothetical protein
MSETNMDVMLPGQTVEWAPVSVSVTGTKLSEKRLSVINNQEQPLTMIAAHALIDLKGKVGDAIREKMAHNGHAGIAKAVLDGNYKPLAQAIAVRLGRNITLTSRKDYEALYWAFENELQNLKNGGVRTKSDGTVAPTEQRKQVMTVLAMLAEVRSYIDAFVRDKQEKDAAREAEQKKLEAPTE